MFNLLVSGAGWSLSGRDTLPAERIFTYTDDGLRARFRVGDQLNIPMLNAMPALFLEEGRGDQIARVGTVNRARVSGRQVTIEYSFDASIPAMMNSQLHNIANELDMVPFEFMNTHWAIKDVDLYQVLFRNIRPRRSLPTVFQIPEQESINPRLISVMMPFDAAFTPVFKALCEAADEYNLECQRADNIWRNPMIMQDVVSLIDRSKIVICDLTNKNPNVFYEMGIAHALGREVIMITQVRSDIPFDVQHLRYVHYHPNPQGLDDLREAIKSPIINLLF